MMGIFSSICAQLKGFPEGAGSGKALSHSERQLRLLLESTSEAVFGVNRKGECSFANRACINLLGFDHRADLMGQNMRALIQKAALGQTPLPALGDRNYQTSGGGTPRAREAAVQQRRVETGLPLKYRVIPVMDGGKWIGAVLAPEGAVERGGPERGERPPDSQPAHAARLSMVGNMAMGMAHEITQPLTAINGYTQACIRRLRSGKGTIGDIVSDLEKVSEQVARAADIIKWLREAVKKEEAERTPLDINHCITEVARFMGADIRAKNSDLGLQLADALPPVMANKVQIQQVLINLVQNSLQASVRGPAMRHQITIRTSMSPEGMVSVETRDNGPGLPDKIPGDLFEPFFSTTDEGLGLGLSISSSIIEAHGGRLWARSDYKDGAAFVFILPAIK